MDKTIEMRLDELIKEIDPSIDANDLNNSTDLSVDYNFDSLSIITLVIKVEEAFNIQIPDDCLSFENLRMYSSLLDCIKRILSRTKENE